MVGFGKKLREAQNPEWKHYYINYKMMKRKLKDYVDHYDHARDGEHNKTMRKEFARLLDWQIEKIVLFLLEQQGQLAARLSALRAERENLGHGANTDNDHGERVSQCVEAYRDVGAQLLDLLNYVEINATGIRKILKKFDKRAAHTLTDYYVASRSNHPYSQLQQVFRHVGIGAMVGALTRSIAELKHQTTSLYDEPKHFIAVEDPIIHSIKVAQERLTNSTSFLKYVAKQLLDVDKEEEFLGDEDDFIRQQYHFMSLLLNLVNTFLYMVNTYIIVPTADKYAYSLGAAPTLCGVIIGSMAVAQLISSVYFSAWSNTSYNYPLIFSSVVLLLGNLLYAIAYDFRSLSLLILGRILCGLGSARAVNRRYISDWVPTNMRLKASAGFVSASALGMATGPALAGLFEMDKSFVGLTFNANTLPGWVMAMAWLVYIIWALIGFKEPVRLVSTKPINRKSKTSIITNNTNGHVEPRPPMQVDDNLTQSLLDSIQDGGAIRDELYDYEDVGVESGNDEKDDESPVTSIAQAYSLLTTPVKVQLLIYFMLKYAMEIVLSESSVVTSYYFGWSTRAVAAFLALLGLTVLPINFLVGSYVSNIFEDRQILFASQVITCLGLAICFVGPVPYTVAQYVTGSLITFVGAEVLEGVNLSLLSKVMSVRLTRGTYNNGLLSTEAGTLARVVADGTITFAGYLGTSFIVNVTIAPALLIGLVSLISTTYSYNSLF